MNLILSLFHGIDIFGRGFESEGFCVVRAGEFELGFDVRDLTLPSGKFDGVIAGTPCQQFSTVNRTRQHQKDNSHMDFKLTLEYSLILFERWLTDKLKADENFLVELSGKNLACFCPLDQDCHADILLDYANRDADNLI